MKNLFRLPILLLIFTQNSIAQTAILTQNLGHTDKIEEICVSPNGKYILSGDSKGHIILWDRDESKEIRSFYESDEHINTLKFASDGKSFYSASKGKTISQWNIETGEKTGSFHGSKAPIVAFTIDRNNRLLAGNSKGEVLIFDVSTKLLNKTISPKIKVQAGFAFSTTNNLAVIFGATDNYGYFNKACIFDYNTGKEPFVLEPDGNRVIQCQFTDDGKYLVALCRQDDDYNGYTNIIRMFDTQNGKIIRDVIPVDKKTNARLKIDRLAVNSKSGLLAIASYTKIQILEMNTGQIVSEYETQSDAMCFDEENGNLLISNWFHLFSIKQETSLIAKTYYCYADPSEVCEVSNNKGLMALGSGTGIKIYNLETGKFVKAISEKFIEIFDLEFSSNDETIAILHGKSTISDTTMISLYNIQTGARTKHFAWAYGQPSSFSISKDISKVAVSAGSWDWGKVKIFSLVDGREIHSFSDFKVQVNKVTFIKNDESIIASGVKTTRIYNVITGAIEKTYKPHGLGGNAHVISENGSSVLSVGGNADKGALVFWDCKTGKTIQSKFEKVDQVVMLGQISPDNSIIVAYLGFWFGNFLNNKDTEVSVWDSKSGVRIGKLAVEKHIIGLYFSKTGDKIITVSRWGQITYWNSKTLEKIGTIVSIFGDRWVAHTPNGFFDGNESGFRALYFVNGLNIIPLESLFEQYYTPNLLSQVLSGEKMEKPTLNISQISLPPKVKITNPTNNTSFSNQSVKVSVVSTDQGGGIDEVRLYHNGKLLDGTTRGFKSTGQNHEFTITLTNGENRIKATAFNSQRTESIPDEIVVHFKAPEIIKPNMHILAVGINNYLNPKYNLNYAKNDADAFVKSLSAGASSLFGKVEVTTINDANATKTGILAAIEKIKSASKAEDVFVFYYAGHGVMSSGNGVEKPLFYLVPHDVTKMYEADEILKKSGISATEIGEFSKTIKAQKQLFVIDACQSGGAMQTLAMRGAAEEKAIAQLARSTGTYFIAASGTEQFATEVAELGHGIFTYSVIEALKGSCKSQDGKVTVNLLKSCVEDLVPELSKKHKGQPQFPTGYGFGMDFPVVMVK